jgi:hypothetical protein
MSFLEKNIYLTIVWPVQDVVRNLKMSAGVVLDIQLYMHSERQYNILSVSLIYFRHILFRGVEVDRTVGWGGIMSGLD